MVAADRFSSRQRNGETGASVVEFVLIIPVLLILVFGIINFGYLFGQKLALNQAVREGARMGVVPGGPRTGTAGTIDEYAYIRDRVRGGAGGLIQDPSQVAVQVFEEGGTPGQTEGCEALKSGDQLRVTAQFTAKPLMPWFLPALPNTFDLESAAVFRCEWGA